MLVGASGKIPRYTPIGGRSGFGSVRVGADRGRDEHQRGADSDHQRGRGEAAETRPSVRELEREHPGTDASREQDAGGSPNGKPVAHVVRARKEVILAGGAYNTPQLLMLSGVGPRDELEAQGIDVLVDAPGVGTNLHDRYEVSLVWELNRNYPIFEGVELDIPKDHDDPDRLFAEWASDRDGPYSTNGSLAAIVGKSSVATDADDLIVFSLPIDFRGYYPGYAKDGSVAHNRMTIVVLKAHTHNRAGRVTLRWADPRDVPDIRYRYFDEGSPGFEQSAGRCRRHAPRPRHRLPARAVRAQAARSGAGHRQRRVAARVRA